MRKTLFSIAMLIITLSSCSDIESIAMKRLEKSYNTNFNGLGSLKSTTHTTYKSDSLCIIDVYCNAYDKFGIHKSYDRFEYIYIIVEGKLLETHFSLTDEEDNIVVRALDSVIKEQDIYYNLNKDKGVSLKFNSDSLKKEYIRKMAMEYINADYVEVKK